MHTVSGACERSQGGGVHAPGWPRLRAVVMGLYKVTAGDVETGGTVPQDVLLPGSWCRDQVDGAFGVAAKDAELVALGVGNAGVPPAQVADWAGHSVEVLLRVYAKCVDGQEAVAKRRIDDALGPGTSAD